MKILTKIIQVIIMVIIGLWLVLGSTMILNTYFIEEVAFGKVIDIRCPLDQEVVDVQTKDGKIMYVRTNIDLPFYKYQPEVTFEIGKEYTFIHTPLLSMLHCRLLKGVHECK